MKGFLYKLLVFGAFALLTHVIAGYHMNGDTDPNYMRLTPNTNTGLVIGTSRAAQAICPSDINDHIGMFNAAFSLYTSPYGEVYYNFVMKVLNQDRFDQFFVLCVDPWSLSICKGDNKGEDKWPELQRFLARSNFITYPNWSFILDQYDRGWGNIIMEHYRPTADMFLHQNGWLEVKRKYDASKSEKYRAGKLRNYRNEIYSLNKPSKERMIWLKKMIAELKKKGTVLMIRIPVHTDFFEMEHSFWPSFESEMYDVAMHEGITFWSPKELNEQLIFNDGHHMNYNSSHQFSRLLNQKIATLKGN
jgi:hypothetical protein